MTVNTIPFAKSFLGLFLLASFFSASGQPVEFGAFAGGQMTGTRYFVRDEQQTSENKYGFNAGLSMKVPFETNLFFSPALFYSLKGFKVKLEDGAFPPDSNAVDNNTSIHTVEIAFLLQYDFGTKPTHVFLRFGPSLDFQMRGTETFHLKNGSEISRKMRYGFGDYGRYSANFLVQPGIEFKRGMMLFFHYTLGIANINNADYGPKIHHKTLGISIGTYFNRRKNTKDTGNKQ